MHKRNFETFALTAKYQPCKPQQHFPSFAALEGMAILSNGSQIRQQWSLEILENKEHSEEPHLE